MPAIKTDSRVMALAPAVLAELPTPVLILAIYASDYLSERRPDLAKVAAFAVDGANRLGLADLVDRTCFLVSFWQRCEDNANTRETWADHRQRFDNDRIIHCTFGRRDMAVIRRHLRTLAAEAVTA